VKKIRLTGGEPLVRQDVVDIVKRLNELRIHGLEKIAMTTNGILLPKKGPALAEAGLNSVNISLDTLSKEKFLAMTRRNGLSKVMQAIEDSVRLGLHTKVNAVVVRGTNEEDVTDLVDLTATLPVEVRFIEFMPFDGNRWSDKLMVPYMELIEMIEDHYNKPLHRCLGVKSDVSKVYQVPGHVGHVGFITSMSDHFCSSCNRTRITADGNFKVCLFGNTEVNLRDLLREHSDDNVLVDAIAKGVSNKKERHAGMNVLATSKNRPMITIGG